MFRRISPPMAMHQTGTHGAPKIIAPSVTTVVDNCDIPTSALVLGLRQQGMDPASIILHEPQRFEMLQRCADHGETW